VALTLVFSMINPPVFAVISNNFWEVLSFQSLACVATVVTSYYYLSRPNQSNHKFPKFIGVCSQCDGEIYEFEKYKKGNEGMVCMTCQDIEKARELKNK
jgi:predicted pyridoxine 5'-phosphate oxidase superfamily flavin-nucleotide-binding protein